MVRVTCLSRASPLQRRRILFLPLLVGCSTPDRWSEADAACRGGFSADCEQTLAAHFRMYLSGQPRLALLDGVWSLYRADLGPTCPDWADAGSHAAACVYNAAAEEVRSSSWRDEDGYLTLEHSGVLVAGRDLGYLHPLFVTISLVGDMAGPCAQAWLGEEGLARCTEEDCFPYYEAREQGREGCDTEP